jgi:transcriptional regulator with XRE-family HTH domain
MTPPARQRLPVFPGFREIAERRHCLVRLLEQCRIDSGLTQTEVAARMGTSQSAVARLESGDADVRLSTIDRYAAALGRGLDWQLRPLPQSILAQEAAHAAERPFPDPGPAFDEGPSDK